MSLKVGQKKPESWLRLKKDKKSRRVSFKKIG